MQQLSDERVRRLSNVRHRRPRQRQGLRQLPRRTAAWAVPLATEYPEFSKIRARRDRKRRNLIRQRKEEAAERLGLGGAARERELGGDGGAVDGAPTRPQPPPPRLFNVCYAIAIASSPGPCPSPESSRPSSPESESEHLASPLL